MADSVIMVGWNRVFPGHEKDALESFTSAVGFFSKQVQMGNAESFEPILLDRHGGDLNGFMLLRGSAAKLTALRQSEEFRELLLRTEMHVSGIGVVAGFTGEGTVREMALWQKIIS